MIKVEKATRDNLPASEHERIADPETVGAVLMIKGSPLTIFEELCSLIVTLRKSPVYSELFDAALEAVDSEMVEAGDTVDLRKTVDA